MIEYGECSSLLYTWGDPEAKLGGVVKSSMVLDVLPVVYPGVSIALGRNLFNASIDRLIGADDSDTSMPALIDDMTETSLLSSR